ncbi:MAG: hypothetical protein KDE20_14080 [Caldilineaceae bacterium]|nr:hypothetical protein [Caldilineaceae bacterium]
MILGSGLLTASGWPKASDWLIRDEFTDTRAAGSVNGTAATPGPGIRVVTGTESKLSVGSGNISISPNSGIAVAIGYSPISYAAGLAFLVRQKIIAESVQVGWATSAGATESLLSALQTTSTQWRVRSNDGNVSLLGAYTPGTYYNVAIVAIGSRMMWFVLDGEWKFLWVNSASFFTSAPNVANAANASSNALIDYLRVIQLPAPFNSDTGLATDTHSGAVSAGTTFTHEGNHILEYAATVPSGDNVDVAIRMQDADNYWFCRVNSSGDISLLEVIDGDAPVQRSTAAGVVSNGHRVVVIAEGSTIKGYSNNTLRWTYASATNFATATAGKVLTLGTGGAVSDLKTWPRTLSGTAASILNKVSA